MVLGKGFDFCQKINFDNFVINRVLEKFSSIVQLLQVSFNRIMTCKFIAGCKAAYGSEMERLKCVFGKDCRSVSCCADVPFFALNVMMDLHINYDPVSYDLTLGVNTWHKTMKVRPLKKG